jgi:CheY-like chemotaxis protein
MLSISRALAPPTPSILIVDTDTDTRAFYRQSLARGGYDVVMEASDGRDALVQALAHRPALVITEIRLPFIDGYALCELLRRDGATANVPIVVITSEARPAQIGRAQQSGADVVLVKPTTLENILVETRRLLAHAEAIRARAATPPANASSPREKAATLISSSEEHHGPGLSKSFSRFVTATPPASPPSLVCPSCDRPLTYLNSQIGGVSHHHPEQWDYYECISCGTFQLRRRTRSLRKVS